MRIPCTSLAFILLLIAPAAAQTPAPSCPHPAPRVAPTVAIVAARRTEHQACAADMAKFCADVPPGCGRPMQCLHTHAPELSASCTDAIAALHAARAQSH